ncbi:MAG TPA: squalene synthase HpnC, partial [Armatimonadota bacterium]|nr:squalene synthase HpnC [Armatimonadota bacterium]
AEGRSYSAPEARAYTEKIARTHYENFTVVSWFLPRELRQHMFNIYAYCRWSDDLGDEIPDPALALQSLEWWRGELEQCYAGRPNHPVFVALRETIDRFEIPAEPFHHLLDAFVQDQTVKRFPTYAEVEHYCTRSANPVGRLVLYLFGFRDAERQRFSDATCTALQLANFWQDVTLDWEKGRVYLPLEDLARFGVTEEQISARRFTPEFRELMRFEVDRARQLFAKGLPLVHMVPKRLRLDLELFTRGGETVLSLIEAQGYDVLSSRPALSRGKKAELILRRLVGSLAPGR